MSRLIAILLALGLSACSVSDEDYYADIETQLRAAGYMRTETAPPDAPFSNDDLARNFERIALYSEYTRRGDKFVARESRTLLSKWVKPLQLAVIFGDSVTPEQRRRDLDDVRALMDRLSRLSGLEMRLLRRGEAAKANFMIIFANRAERREVADDLATDNPRIDPAFLGSLRNSPRAEVCLVHTFWDAETEGAFSVAVVTIKSETAGLMRKSCIHEEMTQALGLGNDDASVRPSIFNDDEEFALLTAHDELLLKILYDPSLRPGMKAPEVRQMLPDILRRLRPAQTPERASDS